LRRRFSFLRSQYASDVTTRLILVAVVFGTMLVEAGRAAANERAQRALGGVEPAGDVYAIMRVVYPVAFLAMFVEGALRASPFSGTAFAGAALFVAAKCLKWWAILSLGPFWTFRVIVVPGARLIAAGPYRWLRHPNYVGVMGEMVGAALMAGAPLAGAAGIATFGWLIVRRVSVEERALREATR
jgi:methyltransferase